MSGRSKVPRKPPRPLEWGESDIATSATDQALWRIHKTSGPYPTAWDDYLSHGPLCGMRWDPHPVGPPEDHPDCAVLYAAYDLETCLAEVFQAGRRVDTTRAGPYATAWFPARALRLLDLTGDWPMRMGAAHALLSTPKSTCRNWAHAIASAPQNATLPIEGLLARSTVTGKDMPVLFAASRAALTAAPAFTSPLDGPKMFTLADNFAARYKWTIT